MGGYTSIDVQHPPPPRPRYIIYIPTQRSNKRPFPVKLEWNKPHLTKFIITDAKSFMVQKFTVLCCPTYLHNTARQQQYLIEPATYKDNYETVFLKNKVVLDEPTITYMT